MGLNGVGNNQYIYQPQQQNNLGVNTQQPQTQFTATGEMSMNGSILTPENFAMSGITTTPETSSTQVGDNYSTTFLQQNLDTLDMLTFMCGGDNATLSQDQKLNLIKDNFTNIQLGGVPTNISSSFPSWVDASNVLCVTNNDGTTDFYSGDIKVGMQIPGETTTTIETFDDNGTTTMRQEVDNSGTSRTIETFVPNHTKTKIEGAVTTTYNPETGNPTKAETQFGNGIVKTETFEANEDGSFTKVVTGNVKASSLDYTVRCDSDGNVLTNVKNGENFDKLMTRLGITEQSDIDAFVQLNSGVIKSFKTPEGKTIRGFNVGAEVKIPAKMEDSVNLDALDVDAKAEKVQFAKQAEKSHAIPQAFSKVKDSAGKVWGKFIDAYSKAKEATTSVVAHLAEDAELHHIEYMQEKGIQNAEKLYEQMKGIEIFGHNNLFGYAEERAAIKNIIKDMSNEEFAYTLLSFRSQNDGRESLIECMFDEQAFRSSDDRQDMISLVRYKLAHAAYDLGIDVKEFEEQMMDSSLRGHNIERFDTLCEGMAMQIITRNGLTSEQVQQINGMSDTEKMEMSKWVNHEAIQDAENNYTNYKDHEGWTGKVADGVSALWGSKNRSKVVEPALEQAKQIEQELNAITDPVQYAAKFEEIYGVKYDPVAIATYNQVRENAEAATIAYQNEQAFANECSYLLAVGPELKPETKSATMQSVAGAVSSGPCLVRTEEQVFEDEKAKFMRMLGPMGEMMLEERVKAAGFDPATASNDEVYGVMYQMAKEINEGLHKNTMEATNGVSIQHFKKQCDDAYYTAYGTKNDALKIVNDYVSSQRVGEAVVKGISKTLVAIGAAALAAIPGGQVAAAFIMGGTIALGNAAIDTTDALFTKEFRDKKDSGMDWWTAAKEVLPPEEFNQIMLNALVDGAVGAMGVGYGAYFKNLQNLGQISGLGRSLLTSSANFTTSTMAEMGLNGGEINLNGVTVKFLIGTAGSLVGYKISSNISGERMSKAANGTINKGFAKTGGMVTTDYSAIADVADDIVISLDPNFSIADITKALGQS